MRLLFPLLFILLLAAPLLAQSTCPLTPSQLKQARIEAAKDFISKTNFNATDGLSKIYLYMTDDAVQIIETAGTFEPILGVAEYQLIFWQEPIPIQLRSYNIIEGSYVWLNDSTLFYAYNNSFNQDFYGRRQGVLDVGVYNLVHYEVLTFVDEPCLPIKIKRDFVGLDPYGSAVQNLAGILQTQGPESLGPICGFIQMACPVNTSLQQYSSVQECANFLLNLPRNSEQTFCPYGFGNTNSTMCRLVHLNLAFIDPFVHCPHLGPNSMPCMDGCIDECAACVLDASLSPTGYPIADPTSNSYCASVINYTDANNLQSYECRCLDSTISRPDLSPLPGRKYCQPITCSADYQCPVRYGTATCVEGKCVPRNGFVWDSSMAAFSQKNMAKCPHGDNRIFWNNGLPECIAPGYCQRQQDPTSRWQCATSGGGPHDYNAVKCKAIDTLDFGIPQFVKDALGPRQYGCICNYGFVGGLGYPCVCPAGKTIQWLNGDKVCLSAGECTQDYQCPTSSSGGKHCLFTTGNPIGVCKA